MKLASAVFLLIVDLAKVPEVSAVLASSFVLFIRHPRIRSLNGLKSVLLYQPQDDLIQTQELVRLFVEVLNLGMLNVVSVTGVSILWVVRFLLWLLNVLLVYSDVFNPLDRLALFFNRSLFRSSLVTASVTHI